MSKCYKKPFLTKVIARIDFTSTLEITQKGISKKTSENILKSFPIPEPKEILNKEIQISDTGAKEILNKQNHLLYHGLKREKTLCISPNFAYIEFNKYESDKIFRDNFFLLLDAISDEVDYSVSRFGIRYINQISIDNEKDPLDWGKYINDCLTCSLDILEDKKYLSRAFSSIVQQYDDGMNLTFQFGMHNPDFPSRIKRKLFILDYDASYQGVLEKDDIKTNIEISHERIETLFEASIKNPLRDLMEEVKSE